MLLLPAEISGFSCTRRRIFSLVFSLVPAGPLTLVCAITSFGKAKFIHKPDVSYSMSGSGKPASRCTTLSLGNAYGAARASVMSIARLAVFVPSIYNREISRVFTAEGDETP